MLVVFVESRCGEAHGVSEASQLVNPLDIDLRRHRYSRAGHPQFGLGKLELQTDALQRLPRD
eukprot:3121720-Pyramimonas_sp.AAC.2